MPRAKALPVKSASAKPFVKEWRKYRNDMTQGRLAGRIEMSVATISQLETGDQGYSPETLAALANAFDCEVGDLFRDPLQPDYQLWQIIRGLAPEARERALRVIKALENEAA